MPAPLDLPPRRVIYRGTKLDLAMQPVRLADGGLAEREVVLHRGAVALVPMVDADRVCLVYNDRHAIGETLHVAHGEGSFGGADADAAADSLDHDHDHADDHDEAEHAHGDHADLVVVGRMQPTGTPWDRAVVVPIEYNWLAHDLPIGHAAGETRIRPRCPVSPPSS